MPMRLGEEVLLEVEVNNRLLRLLKQQVQILYLAFYFLHNRCGYSWWQHI